VTEDELTRAYEHSDSNQAEVRASEECGCFHCLAVFPPEAVRRWIGDGDFAALCPRCGLDSVIGSASGFPLTPEFLTLMQQHWFGDGSAGDA
jgi:hypothetical protein